MSSSHKKTQKKKRPVVSAEKVNDDDYVQIDVTGDGNCFYYSLYGAAKYHADGTTYDKLLTCMGIRKESVTNEKTFAEQMRLSLAREILKGDGIMEQQEQVPIQYNEELQRGQPLRTNFSLVATRINAKLFNPKINIDQELIEKDNLAFYLGYVSYFLAVVLIVGGIMHSGGSDSFWKEVLLQNVDLVKGRLQSFFYDRALEQAIALKR
jgi:hypothetical protein